MTKKKRPTHSPRIRLSSFERALRDATLRLEKATQERTDCLMKLDRLAREIPYLDDIVRALTPAADADDRPLTATNTTIDIDQLNAAYVQAKVSAPEPDSLPAERLDAVDQAAFLARFMPRPGRTTTTLHRAPPAPETQPAMGSSSDPDEFLADEGPGRQILE